MSNSINSSFYPKQTQQTKDTIQKQELATCRICFQQMQVSSSPRICNCHPSHSPIHQACLSQWVTSAVMHEDSFFSYYITCNVCKSKIFVDTESSYQCIPLKKVDFWRQEKCCTFMMMLVLFIGLGMAGISVMLLENAPDDEFIKFMAYSSLAIGLIITLLDMFCIVYFMFLKKDVKIKGVKGLQLKQVELPDKKNGKTPRTPKTPGQSDDSYANLQIQITSQEMLEDITED